MRPHRLSFAWLEHRRRPNPLNPRARRDLNLLNRTTPPLARLPVTPIPLSGPPTKIQPLELSPLNRDPVCRVPSVSRLTARLGGSLLRGNSDF